MLRMHDIIAGFDIDEIIYRRILRGQIPFALYFSFGDTFYRKDYRDAMIFDPLIGDGIDASYSLDFTAQELYAELKF